MKINMLIMGTLLLFSCDPEESDSTKDAGNDAVVPIDDVGIDLAQDSRDSKDLRSDANAGDLSIKEDLGHEEDLVDEAVYGFVAQGHVGRLTYSCDGKEWNWNKSDDDSQKCYDEATGNIDCDHGSGAGKGLAHNSDFLFATFGWGEPGGIFRSANGEDWEEVLSGTTFGGLAAGNGIVLAGGRQPKISTDNGATWSDGGDPGFANYNVRATSFADGVFILVMQDGDPEVRISSDGTNWRQPTSIPPECGSSGGTVVGKGSQIVMFSRKAICQSEDQGDNWTLSKVGDSIGSGLVQTGDAFVFWDRTHRWSSADGKTWASQEMPSALSLGSVAYGDGVYVAINGGWKQWYENQTFWYSTDGLSWTEASQFTQSHTIRKIIYAPVKQCRE